MKDQGNKDQQFDKNARPGGNQHPQGSQEQGRDREQGTQNQPHGSRHSDDNKGQNISKSGNQDPQANQQGGQQGKGKSQSADLNQPDTNEANRMGAISTGIGGTEATASQQQGQGLKSAKNPTSRSGSDSGQNTNKKGS